MPETFSDALFGGFRAGQNDQLSRALALADNLMKQRQEEHQRQMDEWLQRNKEQEHQDLMTLRSDQLSETAAKNRETAEKNARQEGDTLYSRQGRSPEAAYSALMLLNPKAGEKAIKDAYEEAKARAQAEWDATRSMQPVLPPQEQPALPMPALSPAGTPAAPPMPVSPNTLQGLPANGLPASFGANQSVPSVNPLQSMMPGGQPPPTVTAPMQGAPVPTMPQVTAQPPMPVIQPPTPAAAPTQEEFKFPDLETFRRTGQSPEWQKTMREQARKEALDKQRAQNASMMNQIRLADLDLDKEKVKIQQQIADTAKSRLNLEYGKFAQAAARIEATLGLQKKLGENLIRYRNTMAGVAVRRENREASKPSTQETARRSELIRLYQVTKTDSDKANALVQKAKAELNRTTYQALDAKGKADSTMADQNGSPSDQAVIDASYLAGVQWAKAVKQRNEAQARYEALKVAAESYDEIQSKMHRELEEKGLLPKTDGIKTPVKRAPKLPTNVSDELLKEYDFSK